MNLNFSIFPLCLASFLFTNNSCAETSQHLSTIVNAEPSVKVKPKYPEKLERSGIEGWAQFSYIVETDGSVSNVILTDSSGYKSFEREAIRAIKKWKFTPAKENGKVIQQCHNKIQMDFIMADKDGGVSRKFLSKYKKIKKALENKDTNNASVLLTELEDYQQRRLSEHAHLKLVKADYAKEIGNKRLQLSSLNSISLSHEKVISPEQKLSILHQKFILNVQLNRYKSALNVYKEFAELEQAKAYLSQITKIKDKIENLIDSNKEIIVNGDIKERDFWYHSLVRNDFSLTNIQGSLNKMDVRCANKRHVYSVEENNTWKIPASWQGCNLYIYGQNNTKFTLIEHPEKTQTTAAIN
jgi:TonB family protein